MTAMLIIHQPGKAPRIGYPIGYLADSIREWKKHYPDASIYVLQSPDVPPPGTAVVVTAEECLAINDAISAAASPRDRVLRQEVGDAALPEPAGFSAGTHDGALFTMKRSTGKKFAKGAMQPLCEWYSAEQMRASFEAGRLAASHGR